MPPPELVKKNIEEFIEIYKNNPCLWEVKNKDYVARDKKDAAYELLVEKLKELEPSANRSLVVKKINNLRSNVRKERKKYEKSLKSGTSDDDVYRIKLWYYDLFSFLFHQYTPRGRASSSNLDSDHDSYDENSESEQTPVRSCSARYVEPQGSRRRSEASGTEQGRLIVKSEDFADPLSSHQSSNSVYLDYDNEAPSTFLNKKKLSRPTFWCKRKTNDVNIIEEVFETERDHIKRPRLIPTEDRCDIIGKNVAMKLRELDATERCVAEKLINDLLFEAEVGHLQVEHAYINLRDILRQNLNLKN